MFCCAYATGQTMCSCLKLCLHAVMADEQFTSHNSNVLLAAGKDLCKDIDTAGCSRSPQRRW